MKTTIIKKSLIYSIIGLLLIYLLYYGSLGYFSPREPGSWTMVYQPGHSYVSSFSMYIAGILLVLLGFFSFVKGKRPSVYYTVCVFVLFLFMVGFGVGSVIAYSLIRVLHMPITPFVYMLFMGVFACFDREIAYEIKKSALAIGAVCLMAAFLYVVWFSLKYHGLTGNSPQIIYLSTGFWPFAVGILLDGKPSLKKHCFIYSVLILAIMTAVLYNTRGWMIQTVLLTIIYTFKIAKTSRQSYLRLSLYILFTCGAVVSVFGLLFPWHFQHLIGRLFSDSRTDQYAEIFGQTSFTDMFFGKGMFATYQSSKYGTYSYIDNGFVQLMFYFGAIPCLLYAALLIIPIVRCFTYKVAFKKKLIALVLVLWIFAMCGLSVFNAAIMDIRFLYIIFVCAYCMDKNNFTTPVKTGKVLLVVDDFKGGAFNSCHHICDYLKSKYEVHLVVLNKTVETRYSMEGVNVHVQPDKKSGVKGFIGDAGFIRKNIEEVNPDAVISFLAGINACTYLAVRDKEDIAFICSERSNPAVLKPSFLLNQLVLIAYLRADAVVVLFDEFSKAYPKTIANKCIEIPNQVLKPTKTTVYGGGVKRIVTCGNSVDYKGYDLLIDAVPLVAREYTDFKVQIYGQFDKTALNKKIAEYGVGKYVSLEPYEPNVYGVLDGAYAYIMTSRVEGFPNALVEGMAVGLMPVVYPCHQGITQIADENSAVLIKENTPREIAKAIVKALKINSDKYKAKCLNASKIADKYGFESVGKKWALLIEDCVKRRIDDETL